MRQRPDRRLRELVQESCKSRLLIATNRVSFLSGVLRGAKRLSRTCHGTGRNDHRADASKRRGCARKWYERKIVVTAYIKLMLPNSAISSSSNYFVRNSEVQSRQRTRAQQPSIADRTIAEYGNIMHMYKTRERTVC